MAFVHLNFNFFSWEEAVREIICMQKAASFLSNLEFFFSMTSVIWGLIMMKNSHVGYLSMAISLPLPKNSFLL